MAILSKLSRREFLALTGVSAAGLGLYAAIQGDGFSARRPSASVDTSHGLSLNLFVHIASDDQVTIVAHRSEMGQGIRTSLPQVLADELEADWEKVQVLQALGDKKYGDQNTDGSQSVRKFYQTMREMGASAKLMLCQAAANQWQIPLASCVARDHRVTNAQSGDSLGYGELAAAASRLPVPDVKQLMFKTPDEFKYIGKPMGMVDFKDMVRGAANYGIDTQLPDMVYASIERCPVLGGKVKSFDAAKSLQVPGVLHAIKIEGGIEPAGFSPLAGVAIIATNTWSALAGRKALSVEWENGVHATYDSQAEMVSLMKGPTGDARTVAARGDISGAFTQAVKTYEAVYSIPYLEHATMEPPAATVRITGNTCEVWACVQNPQDARTLVAKTIGFSEEQVTLNVTLLGGAFGRKSKADFVAEAALLAKLTGKPVKLTWSREDTFRSGYYHAFSVQHFKAALDENHQITGMDSSVVSPTIMSLFKANETYLQDWELEQGFSVIPYNIPHWRARNFPIAANTRIGWMRSVYNINHAFALNSFIDEVARLKNLDPLEYQLAAIGSDRLVQKNENDKPSEQDDYAFSTLRLKNALRAVQTSSGWPASPGPSEGWGIAVHHSFLSYVAVATKVLLEQNQLRIMEVHIAIDCGQVVNPDRVHSQMEGSVIFGLSTALFGEITFKDGAVEQSSFDNYALLRINQSPKIVVTLIKSDKKHSGVGEPGVPPVAASITNAIAAAGGPRIRTLPIKNHLSIV